MKRILIMSAMAGLLFACNPAPEKQQVSKYPETKKIDHVDTYFGVEVADPYRWLEDDRSEETATWVEAENEVTFAYLNNIPFRDKIKERLESLMDYERIYAPTQHGNWYYFYRNDGLQNQDVLYRRDLNGENEEVFIDPNTFKEDGTISLAGTSFSKDGSLFGYLISEGGSDWRKAIVLNTATKEIVGDTLKNLKFTGLSWLGNEGFFYSSYDKPEGSQLSAKTQEHKVYYHKLGTPQSEDQIVFGGADQERRYCRAYLTEDEQYMIISASVSTTGNELYIKDLSNLDNPLITVVDNFNSEHYVIDNEGSTLFILTNHEAPNNRLVQVDATSPTQENWVDVIPENEMVMTASSAGQKIFATYL